MTTIVVHGTMANGASWYQDSWEGQGFLAGLRGGMVEASDWHDIWHVNGEAVWSIPELGGVFEWNGLAEGLYRGLAAQSFADYLNIVTELTDEPIRVIAHSHGCNVVKLASSLPSLLSGVEIEQAVFLACPHFYEDEYTQGQVSGLDRFNIRKVSKAHRKTGYRFRYALNPNRFGRILNIFCENDKVQVNFAKSFSGGLVPLTGSFMQNVMQQFSSGTHETPMSSRQEIDQAAVHLYEDLKVHVERGCSGIKTHSVMHGAMIGALAGFWLNSGKGIRQVLDQLGGFGAIPCDDVGD